jgi:hypothetical integral membrane protein (TIGR02206 family)
MPTTAPAATFESFDAAHIGALVLTVVLGAMLGLILRSPLHKTQRRTILFTVAGLILLNEVIWHIYQVAQGIWLVEESLPLHMCDAAIFVAVIALIARCQVSFELAYFWGFGGGLQAMLTPDIEHGFPGYQFVRYFLSHGLVIVAVLMLMIGLRMRPSRRSAPRALIITMVCAAAVGLIDWLLGANYQYLCHKPGKPSLLDFLGPWPWYLISLTLLCAVMMALLYLPFAFGKRRSSDQ